MSLHVHPCLVHVCPVSSAQTKFLLPLNPFLCPTNQLRGSPVLPEHSVSIKELQGQLAQVARRHQEEAERFTNTIRQVNTDHGSAPPSLSAGPLETETRQRGRGRENEQEVFYKDSVSRTGWAAWARGWRACGRDIPSSCPLGIS